MRVDENAAVAWADLLVAGREYPDAATNDSGEFLHRTAKTQRLDIAVVAFAERIAADIVEILLQPADRGVPGFDICIAGEVCADFDVFAAWGRGRCRGADRELAMPDAMKNDRTSGTEAIRRMGISFARVS